MSYKKNFVSTVIFQLDYPVVFEIKDEAPKNFTEKIKRVFPIYEVEKGIQVGISVNEDFEVNQNTEYEDAHIFLNKERNARVALTSRTLTLQTMKYSGYKDFEENIKLIINSFRSAYGLDIVNRIGLRYVNNIDGMGKGDPFDLEDYFPKNLFENVDFVPGEKNNISRFVSQVIYNKGDHKVSYQCGNPNKNYPNSISQKVFMIDINAFSEEVPVEEVPFLEFLDKLHNSIKEFFESSIKESVRDIMNEVNVTVIKEEDVEGVARDDE